jgi:hypothetical protein
MMSAEFTARMVSLDVARVADFEAAIERANVNPLLPIAFEAAAITLNIAEIVRRGGPTNPDREVARGTAQTTAEHSDVLMFGGGKKGEAAAIFNALAFAVAVMAFCPGGVQVFGRRYHRGSIGEPVR